MMRVAVAGVAIESIACTTVGTSSASTRASAPSTRSRKDSFCVGDSRSSAMDPMMATRCERSCRSSSRYASRIRCTCSADAQTAATAMEWITGVFSSRVLRSSRNSDSRKSSAAQCPHSNRSTGRTPSRPSTCATASTGKYSQPSTRASPARAGGKQPLLGGAGRGASLRAHASRRPAAALHPSPRAG